MPCDPVSLLDAPLPLLETLEREIHARNELSRKKGR